jgi:hypothetical protein
MNLKHQTHYRENNRGAVLVEFALVALVLYFLTAGIITFGHAIFCAQVIQDSARLAAREIALIPLPADMTFEQALVDPNVKARIFDEDLLVIDIDNLGGLTLEEYFATLPVVNQALRPVMISEEVDGQRFLRYPGALFSDPSTPTGFRVGLPAVVSRDDTGIETIDWVPVFEEIDNPDTNPDPFLVANGGMVALRINYPYQSSAMSGFMKEAGAGDFDPNIDNVVIADDGAVQVVDNDGFTPAGTPVNTSGPGTYQGGYGLGQQLAFAKEVRPFRKFLSAQAIFRREIYQ